MTVCGSQTIVGICFFFFITALLTRHKTVYKKSKGGQAVVAHAFNPSIWEAEAGRFLSLRPAWFTEWVPKTAIQRNPVSKRFKKKKKAKTKTTHKNKTKICKYNMFRFYYFKKLENFNYSNEGEKIQTFKHFIQS